ncbi:MAG: hypothetical protein K8J09_11565 [Planctomycetes bacterium]|nr:hypothetical protein [Planctomycetota bacterium]MCC7395833.1 hypothetical protein [Planctomycetota bacterium]
MLVRLAVVWCTLLGSSLLLPAQNLWIVNAAGGPGAHFTSLPPAVAAAADGDTIYVMTGPFGEGATPFTTNKGLTILGFGGAVPITTTQATPIIVTGLPAGSTFRMVGFTRVTDGAIDLRCTNCLGEVHLENLHAREPDWFAPQTVAIAIAGCSSVTMRDVENFGAPAVSIWQSTAALVQCRFGLTTLGLGGGLGVDCIDATVDIVQPHFDPATWPYALSCTNSTVRIAGDASARLIGTSMGAPILADAATNLTIDPTVTLVPALPGGPTVLGGAVPVDAIVPASWLGGAAQPAQNLAIVSTAIGGHFVVQALGEAGPLLPTPLGVLGIDASLPFAFFPPQSTIFGPVTNTVLVPPSLLPGVTFTTQSLVIGGPTLRIGSPVTFVVQ